MAAKKRPSKHIGAKASKITNITCGMCGALKPARDYYLSNNPIHKTNRLPYCKICLKDMCYDSDNKLDVDLVRKMLKVVDRPFLYDIFKASLNSKSDTIGDYFKNLQLPQYKMLEYADSIFNATCEYDDDDIDLENKSNNVREINSGIKSFFGQGFTNAEYEAMNEKYNFLKNNYPETTNMHIEALKTYVRYKVKEEFATASGDVSVAAKWADLANKAASSAKINPNQLSKADLQGGLNSISELMKATEQAVDIIPILPQFKFRPNDALDFVIWCYINYARDLKGLPLCEYSDVYNFYDRRKQEYIDQYGDPYGIFKNDPTDKNREKIEKFILDEPQSKKDQDNSKTKKTTKTKKMNKVGGK